MCTVLLARGRGLLLANHTRKVVRLTVARPNETRRSERPPGAIMSTFGIELRAGGEGD